ncbi:hypothetical protein Q9R19_11090 [Microbacterium sp. ARD32]|uniref:hypothetical protein n=1 Tax=Microbacterium sp. ARD32 TaxID=2962577 RepID=UPI002880F33D|nr:hypothetical protein [Microbacterium sp. ARD32]MDT0158170.1 hypothetical protein [Microbacterium sp. ARD32]
MTVAPPSADQQEPAEGRTLVTRVRRMASLIPTPWLITGCGAVLLAATAAFGGLQTVPPEPVPTVSLGEEYSGSDLQFTVQGVELRAERGNAASFPDQAKQQKVLAVIVDVVNTFGTPRLAVGGALVSPMVDGIRVDGIDVKPAIAYADDSAGAVWLQPDVPVRLVVSWVVGAHDLSDGDEVRLSLPDSTHRVGTNVQRSVDLWDEVVVGATLTAPVREIPASEKDAA